jgi:hypothetical protein
MSLLLSTSLKFQFIWCGVSFLITFSLRVPLYYNFFKSKIHTSRLSHGCYGEILFLALDSAKPDISCRSEIELVKAYSDQDEEQSFFATKFEKANKNP